MSTVNDIAVGVLRNAYTNYENYLKSRLASSMFEQKGNPAHDEDNQIQPDRFNFN